MTTSFHKEATEGSPGPGPRIAVARRREAAGAGAAAVSLMVQGRRRCPGRRDGTHSWGLSPGP